MSMPRKIYCLEITIDRKQCTNNAMNNPLDVLVKINIPLTNNCDSQVKSSN